MACNACERCGSANAVATPFTLAKQGRDGREETTVFVAVVSASVAGLVRQDGLLWHHNSLQYE